MCPVFEKQMKNICLLVNTLLKGGAEKQALILAGLLNKDYYIWLVVLNGKNCNSEYLGYISTERINYQIVPPKTILGKIIYLYKFFKARKIDICISYLLKSNFLLSISGKLSNIKYLIGGIRSSYLPPSKFFISRFLHNHFLNYSIINNYKGVRDLSKLKFNKDKFIIIPNAISISDSIIIRPKPAFITIISVGRFDISKDYNTALKAVQLLIEKRIKLRYLIVGYGKLETTILQWIRELSLMEYVEIINDPPEIEKYYKNADIYLSTSLYEGLSNSIMEAMNFSLPIVATDVGDNSRLIFEGQNGFLTKKKDFVDISDKLNILITERDKRLKFGKKSFSIIKEDYSYQLLKNRYDNLINSFG